MGKSVERRLQAVILSTSEGSAFALIATAREQLAEFIGVHAMDLILTSRATESNSTSIAAALSASPAKRHIVTSQEEGTGQREQGRGNREQGTGNREQGRGNSSPISLRVLRALGGEFDGPRG